jgi:hypothetical protein
MLGGFRSKRSAAGGRSSTPTSRGRRKLNGVDPQAWLADVLARLVARVADVPRQGHQRPDSVALPE